MELRKIHHPDNFDFLREVRGGARTARGASARGERVRARVSAVDLGSDVFRVSLGASRTETRLGVVKLREEFTGESKCRLQIDRQGGLRLADRGSCGGPSLLRGLPGATFGLSGNAWMLRWQGEAADRFFGMGEKWGPMEKGGRQSLFWNTDVWADHPPEAIDRAEVDCTYAAVPYLIIERRGVFIGILIDSPTLCFIGTNPHFSLSGDDPFSADPSKPLTEAELGDDAYLYCGSSHGPGITYVLVGPDLRSLTCKLQRLVGTTPRPPLWALGHHQCRWGYRDYDDLLALDANFCRHRIPTDGLWLDIDYMDGYRVFTTAPRAFPVQEGAPVGTNAFDFDALTRHGRRVVPILDPGVKVEPGYTVHDEGLAGGHFCLSPSGRPYVGIVWPGRTYFPDFSRGRTRRFWSEHVSTLAKKGFAGFWIDMNDPSTGPVESSSMLFGGGRVAHEVFHNQYALLMAKATRTGLKNAAPGQRPFVLSRSGSIGISRYAALWTGDNISSFRHLQVSLPTSINLALSGIPFNGPDVPGFGGDADARLALRFYQATFLFPFLRNHSVRGSRHQEPWAFDSQTTEQLRRLIVLRYRLLPYLYQLFIQQEQSGQPILAPLFIDESESGDLSYAESEFFVGQLLLAPMLGAECQRSLLLPRGDYYCLRSGTWWSEGEYDVRLSPEEVLCFVRDGTVLPMTPEDRLLDVAGGLTAAHSRLANIELHLFLRDGSASDVSYVWDDGESTAYLSGSERTLFLSVRRQGRVYTIEARVEGDTRLPATFVFVVHGCEAPLVVVNAEAQAMQEGGSRFTGRELMVWHSESQTAVSLSQAQ